VVHRIARAFAEVDERWLREAPVAEVEAWLLAIRGVGPFTTALVMFRGLGRSSAQPIPPQLLRAAKRVYGPRVDAAAVRALSASYGRWAGHWALYLRASAIEGIGARHAA
jgi:DNA-3-methyladenine glycosylase II